MPLTHDPQSITHELNLTLVSDRVIQLLLIDNDPIFRLGLRVFVEQFPDLQVVAEAERQATVLQILENGQPSVDLVILSLDLGRFDPGETSGLELCQRLKTQFPNLPILLLGSFPEPNELETARQADIEGYCPKGTAVSELIQVIRQIAAGQRYWQEALAAASPPALLPEASSFSAWRDRTRMSGLRQIDRAIAQITAALETPNLSALDRAIVAGQRRELLASRWLVEWLLAPRVTTPPVLTQDQSVRNAPPPLSPSPTQDRAIAIQGSPLTTGTWQSSLFDTTVTKIQYGVENLTNVPLEIDILKQEKKRELLELIVQKLNEILEDLRFSQVQAEQLFQKRFTILQDLWQGATKDFFGKYYTLELDARQIEVVSVLLQDFLVVQTEILDKIPQVVELLEHLLFQAPLRIDNVLYSTGTPEAMARAELLIQNLVIQVANAVMQPLLNRFADLEAIKQSFYDRKLISTREIERFRNNLSWKYRLESYISEPKAIFESRYVLFVFNGRGIRKVAIYAPRGQELRQLSGIRQTVTLLLETRDAIAPRLRTVVAFVGRGVVYVLTQVIGRGIGLIGRGILQGIGNSFQDTKIGNANGRKK